MKCFITGASGYIGKNLVNRLLKEGYQITALIHKTKPNIFDKKVNLVYGDISNIESIKTYFNNIDYVFHCAALVKDYGSKKEFYKINLEGTKNLVYLSEKFKLFHILQFK